MKRTTNEHVHIAARHRSSVYHLDLLVRPYVAFPHLATVSRSYAAVICCLLYSIHFQSYRQIRLKLPCTDRKVAQTHATCEARLKAWIAVFVALAWRRQSSAVLDLALTAKISIAVSAHLMPGFIFATPPSSMCMSISVIGLCLSSTVVECTCTTAHY